MVNQLPKIAIIGAGAGGCFAAIQLFDFLQGKCNIQIFEKTKEPLAKLKVSGGGRCNVTHHIFDTDLLSTKYPRGEKELKFAFREFQPEDTINWFAKRGVKLKVEEDGRMFPITDSSLTIISCFLTELENRKIPIHFLHTLVGLYKKDPGFRCLWEGGTEELFDFVVIATGSNRKIWSLLELLGHKVIPPIPSLFTLGISDSDIITLPGVVLPNVQIKLLPKGKPSVGPLLITHWGFSGPAALRLSAFEARQLFELDYNARLTINWLGTIMLPEVESFFINQKKMNPSSKIQANKDWGLTNRFWEWICQTAKIETSKRFSELSKNEIRTLGCLLTASEFQMTSKGVFKEEFVTAGGVSRKDINFNRMESKVLPGLFFTGEVIDVDGITGGFNFQNAWTTAFLAAKGIQLTLI